MYEILGINVLSVSRRAKPRRHVSATFVGARLQQELKMATIKPLKLLVDCPALARW